MSGVIEQPAHACLITAAPDPRPVPVVLRYDRADPLAVRIVFPPELSLDGTDVEWAFARELLDAGLRTPAGDGDVQIWPCGRAQTVLEFHSPEGVALAQFDSAALRRFLRSTYVVVPAADERRRLDVEHGLADLLRETP